MGQVAGAGVSEQLDSDAGTAEAAASKAEQPGGLLGRFNALIDRFDDFQQRHAFVGVPIAVWRKYSEDDGVKLASLISYYAFLSIFPLLIVMATVLSRVLANNPEAADRFITTAAGSFLSIGADTAGNVQPLDVSGPALALALVVTTWSGLAVANGIQDAMNIVYEVPKAKGPGLLPRILRGVTILMIVGIGLPATTAVQGLAGRLVPGPLAAVVGAILVIALNTGLIALAFSRATVADTQWRSLLPGSLVAACAWALGQEWGTSLLTQRVEGAERTYGSFALVVGLLFWFFLLAQVTLYCAELNVVLQKKLWPRSMNSVLSRQAETPADARAYALYPQREQQAHNAEVDVAVDLDAPHREQSDQEQPADADQPSAPSAP